MAELVKAFGDHPTLAVIALSIPFVASAFIIAMVCWMLVCRVKIKGEIDRELAKITGEVDQKLAKLTGVNPRRKRWWQIWR
jgi:hypothetical protein